MKIVYIFKSLANKGGTERILIDKMNYLAEHSQHQIYILTYEQGDHTYAYPLSSKIQHIDLNCRFFTLKKFNILKHCILFINLYFKYKKLFHRQIKNIQPDIVICTTYSYLDISFTAHLPTNIIKIVESHTAKSSIEYATKHSSFKWVLKWIDDYYLRQVAKCSALVTLTEGDAKEWNKIKKANIIPNFTNYVPSSYADVENNKSVICVGRLEPQKGFDLLIQAWKSVFQYHPDWQVHIYGSGGEKQHLLHLIRQLQLENVIFLHDPVPDIVNKYLESSFYVLSSRYEGFGLVLIEAMACGLPCIAFDCPFGPSDIIQNGENGYLIPTENITELAKNICNLIQNNTLRIQMGKKALETTKMYSIQHIMPLWEKLFTELTINTKQ